MANLTWVTTPGVVTELCTEKLLVMDYMPGIKVQIRLGLGLGLGFVWRIRVLGLGFGLVMDYMT